MATDWLPRRREEQIAMAKNWTSVIDSNKTAWSIQDSDISELNNLIDRAREILDKAMSAERTLTITAQCKEAFDNMVACMRKIKSRKFFSPPLADSDFISLGLNPPDTTRSPIAVPTGQAIAEITYPGPHLLMLHIKSLEGTLADPRADYGFRLYFGILPHGGATIEQVAGPKRYLPRAPISGSELPNSQFTRRRKELFVFSPEDSGSTVYFCIRYENPKGQAGPWGPVFSAIIP